MAITIDPLTRIINIPQADLTLVSGSNYSLSVNLLRLALKDIEDDPFKGIFLVDTHRHTAPVVLSGTTYARFVEIINGYTIEFEDGQYSVALTGANNNIVDVLVQNQVSVVANNSSGLIESDLIERSSFGDCVTIDAANGSSGTLFPKGTAQDPVNNVADAITIANERGITSLCFLGDYTFAGTEDISDFAVFGESEAATTLYCPSGTVTASHTEFTQLTLNGSYSGVSLIENVNIGTATITAFASSGKLVLKNSGFSDVFTLPSSGPGALFAIDCYSNVPGTSTPTLDFNGGNTSFVCRRYAGGLQLNNITQGQVMSLDYTSGQTIVDSSCTSGTITIRGISLVTDNSVGATVNDQTLGSTGLTAAQNDQLMKTLTVSKFLGLK